MKCALDHDDRLRKGFDLWAQTIKPSTPRRGLRRVALIGHPELKTSLYFHLKIDLTKNLSAGFGREIEYGNRT